MGWVVNTTPSRSLPPGKTRYPLYRRLGRPKGRSGQVRIIFLPPGFGPRTVHPIASRYTDWGIPPPITRACSQTTIITTILLFVLHGCETWSLTWREERKLRVFENRVPGRIFGHKWDEVTGEWKKLIDEELNYLYCSPNIVWVKKSRRMN